MDLRTVDHTGQCFPANALLRQTERRGSAARYFWVGASPPEPVWVGANHQRTDLAPGAAGRHSRAGTRTPLWGYFPATNLALWMITASSGRSPPSVFTALILSTVSMPDTTRPNTQ